MKKLNTLRLSFAAAFMFCFLAAAFVLTGVQAHAIQTVTGTITTLKVDTNGDLCLDKVDNRYANELVVRVFSEQTVDGKTVSAGKYYFKNGKATMFTEAAKVVPMVAFTGTTYYPDKAFAKGTYTKGNPFVGKMDFYTGYLNGKVYKDADPYDGYYLDVNSNTLYYCTAGIPDAAKCNGVIENTTYIDSVDKIKKNIPAGGFLVANGKIYLTCIHSFGAWATATPATVFATGVQTRSCTVCGFAEKSPIARLTPTITLSKTKVTLKKKQSITIKASNLAAGDYVKSWTSSKKAVATVNKNGKIVAKKLGTSIITVTLASGKKATVKVNVATRIPKNTQTNNSTTLKVGTTKVPVKTDGTFSNVKFKVPKTKKYKIVITDFSTAYKEPTEALIFMERGKKLLRTFKVMSYEYYINPITVGAPGYALKVYTTIELKKGQTITFSSNVVTVYGGGGSYTITIK